MKKRKTSDTDWLSTEECLFSKYVFDTIRMLTQDEVAAKPLFKSSDKFTQCFKLLATEKVKNK